MRSRQIALFAANLERLGLNPRKHHSAKDIAAAEVAFQAQRHGTEAPVETVVERFVAPSLEVHEPVVEKEPVVEVVAEVTPEPTVEPAVTTEVVEETQVENVVTPEVVDEVEKSEPEVDAEQETVVDAKPKKKSKKSAE